ncbi:rCG54716 [Rattus norvegicus]|uniref:RCG54716 n=1 Tax=Rattus norvegicus TaxID=10116 RepID=A6KFM7_RAT|nr:rCG54716 [Rattus norvegicus]
MSRRSKMLGNLPKERKTQ